MSNSISLKQFIWNKKVYKLQQETLRRAAEEEQRRSILCTNCGQLGHRNARSRECPNRTISRGTKRKSPGQQLEEKQQKQSGRQKKSTDSMNVDFVSKPCPHCHLDTHRSSSSKQCQFHTKSTDELLQEAVGKSFERVTRKCTLEKAIKAPLKDDFRSRVLNLCVYVRWVMILTHILANAFILIHDEINPYCFTQNYFYSLTQIVRNETVTGTNSKLPLTELNEIWEDLKATHPNITQLRVEKPNRCSTAISDACVTLATNYSSNIVENFEARIACYLRYKISTAFPTIPKRTQYKIINEYAFPCVSGTPEPWPGSVESNPPVVALVDNLCSELKQRIPEPVTLKALSASPGTFIPVLKYMLKELEIPHEAARNCKLSDTQELPRLFSIFPNPSFAWRFVSLNAETVASMIPSLQTPTQPKDYNHTFFDAMNFGIFRMRSIDEMVCRKNKIAFATKVMTDGFAINFLFARRKRSEHDQVDNIQLDLTDFTSSEVMERFAPVAVDPGRNQAFTGCYGSGESSHQVRRMSTTSYYTMTGSAERTKKIQKEKKDNGLAEIEENLPTAKTADIGEYHTYIKYVVEHMGRLFSFYNFNRAENNFRNYQGRQRAREEMASVFLDGGKKYNAKKRKYTRKNRRRRKKRRGERQDEAPAPTLVTDRRDFTGQPTASTQDSDPHHWKPAKFQESAKAPLIVFGDAMFGRKNFVRISGKKNGVVGVLWSALKRKEREGKLVAIPIDEYYTSQVCNGCGQRELEKVKTPDNISHHGIVVCKNCRILWQRDINAGKNMYHIAQEIWNGRPRPNQFARPVREQQQQQIAATNAVSSSSES